MLGASGLLFETWESTTPNRSREHYMFHRNTILAAFLAFLPAAAAQSLAVTENADQAAYCAYLAEQASAERDFLRTPQVVSGVTQPETGLPTQFFAGASLSLSNFKKAGITVDAAHKNCELYKASTGVQSFLQYAVPSVEKDALAHRLSLIDAASKSLDDLIAQTQKMVDAQNMTRPMLLALVSNRIKLEADRADTQAKIAALYVPPLPDRPLKLQVAAKQANDVEEQKALARLTRLNNWDVALSVGAHQQINPPTQGLEPYGEVSLTYNLASRVIDKHLDSSVNAYGNWKRVEETDVARGMEVLHDQLEASVTVQQTRLAALQRESQLMEQNLKLVGNAETTAALDFRNQLASTQLLLSIESGDAAYRLDKLRAFLSKNF